MYFGILDVFKEHGIKIDMLAACSSATFVACAYSCGTMDQLKERALSMDRKDLFSLFEPSFKGGLFSLDKMEAEMHKFIPFENLEELPVPVSIVASDIVHGDEVVFTMGNIGRAIKASSSMPGLFEPVIWGDRVLLDGGLFNIIPVEAAKAWGADIIIGIDLASTRNLFTDKTLYVKRGINIIKKPADYFAGGIYNLFNKIFPRNAKLVTINSVKVPSMLKILDKAMDYALTERRRGEYFNCDVVIKPNVLGFGDVQVKRGDEMYNEGRRAAEAAIPAIKRLLL